MCCSIWLLKMNATAGAASSARISSPSVERKAGGFQRAGRYVDDELHQALGADVALGTAAEYGHDRPTGYADFQARTDVVLRQCALLEIEFHQGVVVFGGCLDQLLVQSLGLLRFFGRDVELFAGAVLILEAVHFHQQSTSMKASNPGPGLTGYWTTTGFTREAARMDSSVASNDALSESS